jgi:hypothetical protein
LETPYKRVDIKLRGYIDTNTFEPCEPRVEEEWSWQELKTVKYLIHFDGSKFKKSRLAEGG